MTSMLEVKQEDTDYVINKDFASEKRRYREFVLAAIVGVILCGYSVFIFIV